MSFAARRALCRAFSITLLLPAFVGNCRAQEAACSNDGNNIFLMVWENEADSLQQLDLKTGAMKKVPFAPLDKKEDVRGLARSSAGHLLVLTSSTLWAVNPHTGKAEKVCSAPENGAMSGLAYDFQTGNILITAHGEQIASDLWVLPKGRDKLVRVVNRRAPGIWGMTFLPDGRLAFAARGDLWIGALFDEEKETGNFSVGASRFAPICSAETGNYTSNTYGARYLAPLGDKLIVHTGRLGGSGSGAIYLLPVPVRNEEEEGASLAEMAASLTATQEIGHTGTLGYLCTSPDTKTAYFKLEDDKSGSGLFSLKAGATEPVPLDISLSRSE